MNRKLNAIAAAVCMYAASANARIGVSDPDLNPPPTAPTSSSALAGPIYILGTHNTKMTLLVLDRSGAQLCAPNLTSCRPAYGLNALWRSTQIQVAQLIRWDRSGLFGINATELIACFQYFDSPSAANFTCQTAGRGSDATINADMTALAWRAYGSAGLVPLSADKVNAMHAKRTATTAYAAAYGTLPPDRMHALDTEEDPLPSSSDAPAPEAPDYTLETLTVTGARPDPIPTVTLAPSVQVVPIGSSQATVPEVIVDPCVTFQVCSKPPPPPPPAPPLPPPKVCAPQCNEQASLMSATCTATAAQLTGTFAVLAPTAGLIVGVGSADPAMGWLVFRSVGVIGAPVAGGYAGLCLGLNARRQQQCLIAAAQNGC